MLGGVVTAALVDAVKQQHAIEWMSDEETGMRQMVELKTRRWRYGERRGIDAAGNDDLFDMRREG